MRSEVSRGSIVEGHGASEGVGHYVKGDGGSPEGLPAGCGGAGDASLRSSEFVATGIERDDGG